MEARTRRPGAQAVVGCTDKDRPRLATKYARRGEWCRFVDAYCEAVPAAMSVRLLKPVTKSAQRVLEKLVDGLDVGGSKKVDNGGAFMAVHVEVHRWIDGSVIISIAHYFEQGGDLCADPDVVFLRRVDGSFAPISFQNSLVLNQPVRWLEDGTIEVDAREQASIASFANTFLRNIAEQQGIGGAR